MTAAAETSNSPADVVRAVIDGVCRVVMGDTSAMARVGDLYAEPTHVLHPLRPEIPPLVTHEDFRRHAATIAERRGRPDSHRAVDIVVHTTTDPELVVTEFHYETVQDGTTMIMPCVWFTRVRDGRIVEARDYNGQPYPRNQPS